MPDAASYTLTNGSSYSSNGAGGRARGDSTAGPRTVIQDGKWKFQGDEQLPKPRDFAGTSKRYRAGRGSSVPLDLSAFR